MKAIWADSCSDLDRLEASFKNGVLQMPLLRHHKSLELARGRQISGTSETLCIDGRHLGITVSGGASPRVRPWTVENSKIQVI